MATLSGSEAVARSLANEGVEVIFHITGGPNIELTVECERLGIRLIDVRHEQAAAAAAHAYARVLGRTGVCLAPGGPATINMLPGLAHALDDAVPLVALGGSAPLSQRGRGSFQEMDQVALMAPASREAFQLTAPAQIPERVAAAFRLARAGRQGPVYLDLPADVLAAQIESDALHVRAPTSAPSRPQGDSEAVRRVIEILRAAERPLVVTGSGIHWAGASGALRAFIDATGIPCFATPQGRGAVPDDHPRSFPAARSAAFREADAVLVVGTRDNFILSHLSPPRWSPDARFMAVNLDAAELGRNRALEVGIVGDAAAVLGQLLEEARGAFDPASESVWVGRLRSQAAKNAEKRRAAEESSATPIHPLRLMKEVRELLDRDAIVVEDGHDTLGFSRHSIPTHEAGHRLNPGPLGNVGIGVPFGLGAKAAKPDRQVVVISGDSAFGWMGMNIDSCCRNDLPILVVICNNAGITARSKDQPLMPGQHLGYSDYQRVCEAFGGYGERVEKADEIRPALERALASGRPAVVNVIVDMFAPSATQMGFAGGYGGG
ncbi:MAG: thiamine pyrophosphate-binding protein [Deltaproteobacteria bacterium]|nr:thiamine pyrophosphate-binding protein [Deltaproteobacteria bacterium]MBW2396397.1 thiamine pyrophosphate-binding protein [Deltaproteobacteria bacterium]